MIDYPKKEAGQKLSGAEKGQKARDNFDAWMATMNNDGYRQMVNNGRGILKRKDVAKAIGCETQAFNSNKGLSNKLRVLENKLRAEGVLPPVTDKALTNKDKPKEYDPTLSRRVLDSKKSSKLERENIELRAKVKELECKLEANKEWNEVMIEMGMIPR